MYIYVQKMVKTVKTSDSSYDFKLFNIITMFLVSFVSAFFPDLECGLPRRKEALEKERRSICGNLSLYKLTE